MELVKKNKYCDENLRTETNIAIWKYKINAEKIINKLNNILDSDCNSFWLFVSYEN